MDGGSCHCTGGSDQEKKCKRKEKKKKYKKANWLSEGALQIMEKRKDAKGKREKEKYIQLNAELQRIEKRNKKAYFNEQCKEIEEKYRMGKTRDLFKKIGDNKGNFMQIWAQ